MRVESSVTSVSWIPSEAMTGMLRLPMDLGISHYDEPPPDHIDDLEALREADRFRFANELRAWIDVEDGEITGYGYSGQGHMGATTLALGLGHVTIAAVEYPELRAEPKVDGTSVTFKQTTGGHTGAPLPRRIPQPPFVKITAPAVWTTLSLTLDVDGSSRFELTGASQMPRHWVYDASGDLVAKSGMIDFKSWTESLDDETPWGAHDSAIIVTAVETALERQLSAQIMSKGKKHQTRKLAEAERLVDQGDPGTELFLVMDGLLAVEIDGKVVAEVGPGAVLGEMAVLDGGLRTASLRAATPVKVAVFPSEHIDRASLEELAAGRRLANEANG